MYYGECVSNTPPLLCSQIITPFLISMISTNYEKGLEYQTIVESRVESHLLKVETSRKNV